MKYVITVILAIWILFSWGEVAHKQVNHDYEYSNINIFELILDKEV